MHCTCNTSWQTRSLLVLTQCHVPTRTPALPPRCRGDPHGVCRLEMSVT